MSEVEQLLEEGNLDATIDVDIVESYIDFIKSTEPMSLKAAKLMDSVRFGYNGILSDEIEAAIYSKHEENSITRETFPDREGYDELDWKYNEGTNYQRAKEYREIVLEIESEKVEKAQLIEEAKGKNPHLGMSREEVEASLWGKPLDINRTVTKYSTYEQWVYGNGQYLYFDDGILTSFQD